MSNEIITVQATQITPMALIEKAMQSDTSIERMEQLFNLQLRWEENEAKKAYHQAVALFKSEAIDIIKNKRVSFKTDKGTTEYNHAELGQVVNTVAPFLSKYGLSHHWEYSQTDAKIKVTCFLTHDKGYEKSTSLEASADTSGGKNSIQAIGSTTSYLERYTFLAMTGLASREQDDDGRGAGKGKEDAPVITEQQMTDLWALIAEVKANEKQFCTYFHVETIAQLPAAKFASAVKMLESKRNKP
jgi:hypothetical protein